MIESQAAWGFILAISVGAPATPFADLKPRASFKPAPWRAAMRATIDEIKGDFEGEIYLYISDPWRGYMFGHRADEPAYLASGVKMAFMVEVFRQRELEQLSFDEELTYSEGDMRDGAPRVNKLRMGTKLSITTLLDWMMRSSDNAASDMLARRVGLSHVNEGLEAEGVVGFAPITYLLDVRRGVYRDLSVTADDLTPRQVRAIRWTPIWDPQLRKLEQLLGLRNRSLTKDVLFRAYRRFYSTGVNSAPMASVGLLLEKLCRGELVSNRASTEMLALMTRTRTSTHRLLGGLPAGTRVAHKTGSQFRRMCDMGVVTLQDAHPLIIATCTETEDVKGGEAAMARLAGRAYELTQTDHQKP